MYLSGCVNLQNILNTEQTTGIRVHLDKRTVPQLVKKFPAFYGTPQVGCPVQKKHSHMSLYRDRIIKSMFKSSKWYLSGRFPH
jgi:hypothetical protein